MSAFIGYGDIGVWTSNGERDDFLDWFADNRCVAGDPRWEFCKSDALRWPGCGVELDELVPRGETLAFTADEYDRVARTLGPHMAQLLGIIESITRGEWKIRVGSKAATWWHRPEGFAEQYGL